MRTRQSVHRMGLFAICALMALSFACKKEEPSTPTGQPQATPSATQPAQATPGAQATPAARPTPAPAPTKAAQAPRPTPAGRKKTLVLPDPQAVNVADVAIAIRINRVDQALPKAAQLISAFVPMFTADMIRERVGIMLGDPGLAGLDQTRSILLCLFAPQGSPQPAFAALLPVNNDQYKTRFEAMGQFVHQNPGGKTLLVARDEAGAVTGRTAMAQLEAALSQPAASDVSVYVNVEMLMSRYNDAINAGISQMVQAMQAQMQAMGDQVPGGAAGMSIFAMELFGLLEVAKDIKDLELAVTLSPNGAETSFLLRAKPATGLATMLADPVAPDLSVQSLVPGTGAIVGCAAGDTGPARDYLEQVLAKAVAAVPVVPNSKFNPNKMKDLFLMNLGRSQAAAFDLLASTAGGGLSGIMVFKIQDPNHFLQILRDANKIIQESGMSEIMAMQIQFQENARQYKGVSIHKYTQQGEMPMPMGAPGGPPAAFMGIIQSLMNQQAEVAVVGEHIVYTLGSTKIEPVIDAVQAGKPLSRSPLTAQGLIKEADLYLDIHPGRFIAFVLGFMKDFVPQATEMAPKLAAIQVQPISLAMGTGQGKLQFKLAIPLASLIQTRDAIMQSMGQGVAPVAP